MLIQRIPSRQGGPNPYFNQGQTKQGEPSPSQPDGTIQRVGCTLAGAISGAVIGAGSAIYTLRDCANAAFFATAGIPMAGLFMAGGLVAVPFLFAVGGAYEGAESGDGLCEVAKEALAAGRRYDDWWAASHEDYLTSRAEDKKYDAEHGRA